MATSSVVMALNTDHDTRLLITPSMREQKREEWERLWDLNKTQECPVCLEKPDIWDGPMNSDIDTRCTHWACVHCWERIAQHDKRCPVCRDDLTDWLARFSESEMSEEEEDDMDTDDQ